MKGLWSLKTVAWVTEPECPAMHLTLPQPGICGNESSLLDSFTGPRRRGGAFFVALTHKVAEAQCEDYAPAGIIIDADAALMSPHDFHHDGES
jgi:hypothetical protein